MSQLPDVSLNVRELIDSELIIDDATLMEVMIKFEREINKGLKKATQASAEIKCFVTYVEGLIFSILFYVDT